MRPPQHKDATYTTLMTVNLGIIVTNNSNKLEIIRKLKTTQVNAQLIQTSTDYNLQTRNQKLKF